MDTPMGNRSYRNPLSDTQDQILFFGLFVLGALGILFLKIQGYEQLLVTLFPISLMVVYSTVALVTKRYRIREDRAGDNVYYLGFLYTLVSLAYALHDYKLDGSGVEYILKDFGVAIFTTIVGLAGRVFFSQMREDPVEFEREARYALSEASSALRSQLADISTDMSSFKRKIVQIVEEGAVDITNRATQSLAQTVENVATASNEIVKSTRDTFQTFTDHSSELNEAASKNTKALQSLFKRIDKIEVPSDLITTKFDPILNKFDEVAEEALKRNRAQANDLTRLREVIDMAITAAEGLKKTSEAVDSSMSQRIETLKEATSALVEDISLIRTSSRDLKESLTLQCEATAQIRSTIEENLTIARQHREAMAAAEKESRESLQALEQALVSLSNTLVEQLGGRSNA